MNLLNIFGSHEFKVVFHSLFNLIRKVFAVDKVMDQIEKNIIV